LNYGDIDCPKVNCPESPKANNIYFDKEMQIVCTVPYKELG